MVPLGRDYVKGPIGRNLLREIIYPIYDEGKWCKCGCNID